uniref:Uncharacterized protein n=1 Tax=Anas platyrhynchos platyrhynchos TaxID=8840 RepID=A0A493U3Z3_ANAPP
MPGPFRLAVLWGRTCWVEIQAPFPGNPRGKRITVVTWNVGTAMPPNDVTSLLHLNTGETNDVDMIAIG